MSEQLKHELETSGGRLEAPTDASNKIIGIQDKNSRTVILENHRGSVGNLTPVQQKAMEKLEAEKGKATQKGFAEPIITYLVGRCEEDPGFAEDLMQEDKTWNKCFEYIVSQAKKQSTGRCAAVEDRVVYEWAEDYYRAKTKEKVAGKPKTAVSEPLKQDEHLDTENKKSDRIPDKTASENKKPTKKVAVSKPKKEKNAKSSGLSGQMSLFDFL